MKKVYLTLVALLVGALVAVLVVDWALPAPSRAQATVAGDGSVIYAAENGPISSSVYGVDGSGKLVFFYREWNGGGHSAITQLCWSKQQISFLRETQIHGGTRWDVESLDEDAKTTEIGSVTAPGQRATGLSGRTYIAAVAGDGSGAATVFDAATSAVVLRHTAPTGGRILSAVYLPEEDALLAVLDQDGATVKVGRAGVFSAEEIPSPELPEQIHMSKSMRATCKIPLLIVTAAVMLLLALLVVLATRLFLRGKRLALRAAAVSALGLLLGLGVMVGLLLWQTTTQRLEERLAEAGRTATHLAAALSVQDPSSVLQANFYGTQAQNQYVALLATAEETDVLALRDGTLTVAVSTGKSYGTPAEYAYDARATELALQAAAGHAAGAMLTMNGEQTAVYAVPLYANGISVGAVITQERAGAVLSDALRTLSELALVGLMAVAAICVALLILMRRMTRPIGQLKTQMESVSAGNLKVQKIPTGFDELGQMAQAMQEMCMSLSIRQYEVQSTIDSYGRFVPRGLCRLLDRASIMEVSFGDVRSIDGNVMLLSVQNRDQARHLLEDEPFVAFVNSAFSVVDRNARAHGGYHLSSGFDMGAMRLCYPGKATAAVQAGLGLLGELKTAAAGEIAPNFFLMLHHTEFLYGVAGTKDEAFPFLSSQEMEFLTSFSARLADTGAKVVVTNAFLKYLEPGYMTRYIGFVSPTDTEVSYKLYEILDAYPEMERNLRIRYDARFQEAIQLFYKNDYYLARNLFSALLRACPSDGVARWYLFACEHYFNVATKGESDCRLFSIGE